MDKIISKKIKRNIALIGMAGVGKSFFGKHLATQIGYKYIEVDQLITKEANKIGTKKDKLSDDKFIKLEEKAILSMVSGTSCIFDTGGSAVYSEKAMEYLKSNSAIIYLKDDINNIKKRFDDRGRPHLVGIEGKSFEDLFLERDKLYKKYADITFDISKHGNSKVILNKILNKISFNL